MNNITKFYNKNLILDNISFDLLKCTLIVGENGSGKTTLFKILSNLIKKFEGDIDTNNDVSLLLDSPSLFNLKSGYSNLEYFLSNEELEKSKYYTKYFNMDNYINKIVKTYSNGMKKKLSIVIALSKNKKYLLLDEVTNSLDVNSIKLLIDLLIKEKNSRVIFLSSHDSKLLNINLIDEIFVLKNHKLYLKAISSIDYLYYKVKTIDKIDNTYEYVIENDYYLFKINNKKIDNFSKYISKYNVLEMIKVDYFDDIYLRGIYND